jgi:hypothetical protein
MSQVPSTRRWCCIKAYPKWQATRAIAARRSRSCGARWRPGLGREHPDAAVHLLEAGRFAINDRPDDIAHRIRAFLKHAVV